MVIEKKKKEKVSKACTLAGWVGTTKVAHVDKHELRLRTERDRLTLLWREIKKKEKEECWEHGIRNLADKSRRQVVKAAERILQRIRDVHCVQFFFPLSRQISIAKRCDLIRHAAKSNTDGIKTPKNVPTPLFLQFI